MESRFVRDEELCGFDFHLPEFVQGRYWLAVAGCDQIPFGQNNWRNYPKYVYGIQTMARSRKSNGKPVISRNRW